MTKREAGALIQQVDGALAALGAARRDLKPIAEGKPA